MVSMGLESERQVPPGLAGGKTVVSAWGWRPAQTVVEERGGTCSLPEGGGGSSRLGVNDSRLRRSLRFGQGSVVPL